jgi:ribosomal protein L11 methyltransferase
MENTMSGTRIYLRLDKLKADAAFAALETAFEDDGLALTISEIDEKNAIHEVSVYTTGEAAPVEKRMREALQGIRKSASFGHEILPDIDWVGLSLQGLKPVRAERIIVHGSHDRDKVRPTDMAILIEANQAFGTGHHGTTWGCLTMIQQVLKRERPSRALDLGTGSGVLAIAIAKLRHIPVLATDIDPIAVRVAQENAGINGVAALVFITALFETAAPSG